MTEVNSAISGNLGVATAAISPSQAMAASLVCRVPHLASRGRRSADEVEFNAKQSPQYGAKTNMNKLDRVTVLAPEMEGGESKESGVDGCELKNNLVSPLSDNKRRQGCSVEKDQGLTFALPGTPLTLPRFPLSRLGAELESAPPSGSFPQQSSSQTNKTC